MRCSLLGEGWKGLPLDLAVDFPQGKLDRIAVGCDTVMLLDGSNSRSVLFLSSNSCGRWPFLFCHAMILPY